MSNLTRSQIASFCLFRLLCFMNKCNSYSAIEIVDFTLNSQTFLQLIAETNVTAHCRWRTTAQGSKTDAVVVVKTPDGRKVVTKDTSEDQQTDFSRVVLVSCLEAGAYTCLALQTGSSKSVFVNCTQRAGIQSLTSTQLTSQLSEIRTSEANSATEDLFARETTTILRDESLQQSNTTLQQQNLTRETIYTDYNDPPGSTRLGVILWSVVGAVLGLSSIVVIGGIIVCVVRLRKKGRATYGDSSTAEVYRRKKLRILGSYRVSSADNWYRSSPNSGTRQEFILSDYFPSLSASLPEKDIQT